MKKVVIVISIIGILIIGVVGNTVMAVPPSGTPLADWEYIKGKIDGIWDTITDSDYGLSAIDNKIISLDSTARINTAQGFVIDGDEIIGVDVYDSDIYDGGAHFSITIHLREQLNSGEIISIYPHYSAEGVGSYTVNAINIGSSDSTGLYYYELDARKCNISYTSKSDGDDLTFGWGVTTTYSADSL
jgi:hypothetical protein